MPADPTVRAAVLFVAGALVLTLVAFAFGSARRRGLLPMLVMALVGLALLLSRETLAGLFATSGEAVVLREFALALVAVGCIRITVLFVFQTLLAQARIPKILDDLVIALALVAYGIFRLNAVGVNLAGLITTSAVITGALALSAQATLGNLWGGIAIQMEKTCRIGDWVRIDDITGQVVSIRWRYMGVATNRNETIVIPNSTLMKERIVVVARRGEEAQPWVRYLPFELEFDHTPAHVIEVLERAFREAEIPNVGNDPPPRVGCTGFRESGIEYGIAYKLLEPSLYWRTDSDVRVHLFAALARNGIAMPYPRRVVEMRGDVRVEAAAAEQARRRDMLAANELFHVLTDAERARLAEALDHCLYASGDLVFRAGEPADSLYLLAAGEVRVVNVDHGRRRDLATLAAPDYFGEMGLLLGQPRAATVVAAGEVLCYRLDKQGFDAIMAARPELAEALGRVLAQRQAENDATLKALDADSRAEHTTSRAAEFVRRIQQFFRLDSPRPPRPRLDLGPGLDDRGVREHTR
jgi:small-conductance mechanosensitive channel/CRP-like cAMP-binding protein